MQIDAQSICTVRSIERSSRKKRCRDSASAESFIERSRQTLAKSFDQSSVQLLHGQRLATELSLGLPYESIDFRIQPLTVRNGQQPAFIGIAFGRLSPVIYRVVQMKFCGYRPACYHRPLELRGAAFLAWNFKNILSLPESNRSLTLEKSKALWTLSSEKCADYPR